MVHSLRLDRSIKIFHDYAEKEGDTVHLATTKHIVIWDQYHSDILKVTTRQRSKSATAIDYLAMGMER